MKLFFSLLLITQYVQTIIVEHKEISAILAYLHESDLHRNTLVVLDIDNTIAHPTHLIGSDQWVSYHIEQKMKEGLDVWHATQAILPLYFEIQYIIDLIPVEELTVALIKHLQKLGITVVALTLRSLQIHERTVEQLSAIDIDFAVSAFGNEILYGPQELPYLYNHGIIFCASQNKGVVLKHILDQLNHKPTKIIAVDDKTHHLHAIKSAFVAHEIEVIGIRYSYLDEKVAQFDPAKAEHELQLFFEGALISSKDFSFSYY